MAGLSKILATLSVAIGLAQAHAGYDAVCQPPPTQEIEVEPGLFASFACESIPLAAGYIPGSETASTSPTECAKHCGTRNDGAVCSWVNDKCYAYIPGTAQGHLPSATVVTVRKDWDALKTAYDTCQSDLKACQDAAKVAQDTCDTDKNALQTALQNCQNQLSNGNNNNQGPPGPSTGPATGPPGPNTGPSTGPPGPNQGNPTPPPPATPKTCNEGAKDGDVVTIDGMQFTVSCGYYANSQFNRSTANPHNEPNLESCVKSCKGYNGCTMIDFDSNSGLCHTFRFQAVSSGGKGSQHTRLVKI